MPQSIFSNALIATLGRVVTILFGLAATALTTRILSVDGFGVYALILTVATILQLGADFGLYLTLSRELGLSQGRPNENIANIASLRLVLLLGLCTLGLIGFIVVPSSRAWAGAFGVFFIGLIFQSGSQLLMSIFQAYACVWRATIGDIIGRALQVGVLFTGLLYASTNNNLLWVACAYTSGLVLSFGIHTILVPEKRLLRIKISPKVWKHIIQISWPIALMLILNVIYFRIDTVLLSVLRTKEEVGLYSLAYKIIENGLFFPAMIGGLLLPAITSALVGKQTLKVRELVAQGLTLSFSGACILVAILIGFSNEIITLLAGPIFTPSAVLLRILALALGIMFLGNIFGFSLIALGKQNALAALYGVLVVGNIVSNLILIPLYGTVAAAWVTVATEGTATLAAGIMVYRSIHFTFSLRRSALVAFGALCSVWVSVVLLAETPFALRLGVALMLYVAMMYVSGVWNKIRI